MAQKKLNSKTRTRKSPPFPRRAFESHWVEETNRPFSDPDEFLKVAAEYFETTKVITMGGLAYALGFASRTAFNKFPTTKEGKPYAYVHQRVRFLVEVAYEERLNSPAAGGAIFALKNMGWSDKQVLSAELSVNKITRQIVKPKK